MPKHTMTAIANFDFLQKEPPIVKVFALLNFSFSNPKLIGERIRIIHE